MSSLVKLIALLSARSIVCFMRGTFLTFWCVTTFSASLVVWFHKFNKLHSLTMLCTNYTTTRGDFYLFPCLELELRNLYCLVTCLQAGQRQLLIAQSRLQGERFKKASGSRSTCTKFECCNLQLSILTQQRPFTFAYLCAGRPNRINTVFHHRRRESAIAKIIQN